MGLFYGLIPILDLSAGLWNYSAWKDEVGADDWSMARNFQLIDGGFGILAWGMHQFMDNSFMFKWYTKLQIFAEVSMMLLVVDAETTQPAASSSSTYFSYGVHMTNTVVTSLLMPLVTAVFSIQAAMMSGGAGGPP